MQAQKNKKIPQIISSINRTKIQSNLSLKCMNNFINKLEFTDTKNIRSNTARFLKRKNKIQKNKENVDVLVCQSIFYKNVCEKNQKKIKNQKTIKSERYKFIPKKQIEILNKHQIELFSKGMKRDLNIECCESENLKNLLLKNKLLKNRCLIGLNIPQIQQKYSFSRYDLYNLHSYYKSLLQFSNVSCAQFKKGFQTILHINKISLNCQMVNKCFQMFLKDISFNNFVYIYGNIQTLLFTQTVIQIISTIFSKYYRQEQISYETTQNILKQKMGEQDGLQITKYIWQKLCKRIYQKIKIQDIFQLCHQDISICRNIFKVINKNKENAK